MKRRDGVASVQENQPVIRFLARLAVSALLACTCASPRADGTLRLSGFGTIGYATDHQSDIASIRDISQRPDNGFSGGASWQQDSRLGVQLEYGFSPTVDLVGQLVWRDQIKTNLGSATELAYAAIRPRPELDLRVGRIGYDAFLMSDHRNVGYAYTWVKPPQEFYGWIPIFSVDGVDAAYAIHDNDVRWRIKAQAGSSKISLPVGNTQYDFKTNNLLGASVSRQTEHWRLKAAYSRFTSANEIPAFAPLHTGLDAVVAAAIPQISAEAADLRRNLAFKDARITYSTLGAAYDDGTWLAQAEQGVTTASAAVVPHGRMGYVSVGRRIGNWTPYLLRSTSHPGNDLRTAANNWGGLNATLRDPALQTVNTTRIEQATSSIGTRWDFHRQAAFKLQWDSTTISPSGYGLWWRDLAINNQTRRVNVISATVDFTF